MDFSYWVLWEALVKYKTCKVEKDQKRAKTKCMDWLSIWELTEQKPCSTGKVWLTGDILEGYEFLNSLEEVSKNQLSFSCTSSCARGREVSRSWVLNKPRLMVFPKHLFCSFKVLSILCIYNILWWRVVQVYHKLQQCFPMCFGCGVLPNQISHRCCSVFLLSFPFAAFSIFNKQKAPKATGQVLSKGCGWNYKSDKSHQPCLKIQLGDHMGLVREKKGRGKGMIHTLFLLFFLASIPFWPLGSESKQWPTWSQTAHAFLCWLKSEWNLKNQNNSISLLSNKKLNSICCSALRCYF